MGTVLVLDRGNSSLKASLFDGGRIIAEWRDETDAPKRALERIVAGALRRCPPPPAPRPKRGARKARRAHGAAAVGCIEGAAYSSVVPEWRRAIPRVLRAAGVKRVVGVGARIALPFSLLVEAPERVGCDRIAAAAGVVAYGGREAVIVDAGSAVTIDVLAGGAFLGGAIFPGEALILSSLHEGTAALPKVAPSREPAAIPGRDTVQAMRAGSFWGLIGAIKEIARRSLSDLSPSAVVWLTGGGARVIAPHLGPETRFEPDLVAVGLHYLYRMNEK